jgi:hypothetical protein
MRQKLCRRLEELEKVSAAAATRRTQRSSDYEEEIALLMKKAYAWHAVPENQVWLATQPPDYLYHRVQSLRAYLQERASGYFRQVQTRGFR